MEGEVQRLLPITYDVARVRGRPYQYQTLRARERKPMVPRASNERRTPAHSWAQLLLPFSRSPELQEHYKLFESERVRNGLLLEHLDALAADIAYRHSGGFPSNSHSFVTALLDRMDVADDVRVDRDLRLEGCVTWVGRSSAEVCIDMLSQRGDGQDERRHGTAVFVMVARTLRTNEAFELPPLALETEEERRRFERGALNRARRLVESENSLDRQPPTSDERVIIHNLFMQTAKNGGALDRERFEWMESTTLRKAEVMHSQDRNINGKIFGGHLMRLALELAYATASAFSRSRPSLSLVDEIRFVRPIPVGSIVSFSSQVVYVEPLASTVMVAVETQVLNTDSGLFEADFANKFHFAFRCPNAAGRSLRIAVPRTYLDAMRLLQGRRQLNAVL